MNLNTKISRMAKVRKVDGDIGIEIECETKKAIADPYESPTWQLHAEGSLRGHGYEFVLRKPLSVPDSAKALVEWDQAMKKLGVQFVDSKRASVHVHINVQDKRILEVINILCAYWLIEPLLLNIAGEERKGNLFCLGINCADTVHSQLVANLKSGTFFQKFSRDAYRYASINLEALYKFGSLEFRTLRGTQDITLIKTWSSELYSLVENASKYKSPHEMVAIVSAGKHKRFLCSLFSEEFVDKLIKESGYRWRDYINENVPLILDILASRDEWDAKADEVAEKKRLSEQAKLNSTDDHFNSDTWWPQRGRIGGGPLIDGGEVGTLGNRFFQGGDARRWEVWDGMRWKVVTAGEFDRSVPFGRDPNQRYITNYPINPTVVQRRHRELVESGEWIDEIPEELAAQPAINLQTGALNNIIGQTADLVIRDDVVPAVQDMNRQRAIEMMENALRHTRANVAETTTNFNQAWRLQATNWDEMIRPPQEEEEQ